MRRTLLTLLLLLSIPVLVLAATPQMKITNSDSYISGGPADHAKTAVDTVLLIGPHGSGAWHNGQFETPSGFVDWQGWTGRDMTASPDNPWHVSTYHAEGLNGHGAGNSALWCGSMEYPACDAYDEDGGYGNNYREVVEFFGTVADPNQPCLVTIDAWLNHHVEDGYDYLFLQAVVAGNNIITLFETDGQGTNYHLQESVSYGAGQYVGAGENQIHLKFVVESDGGWSDEDCYFASIGACQIDDIRVQMDNGSIDSLSDFEDGTLGDWDVGIAQGVGDFANLWMNLHEIDICNENSTPQVAFIDDGQVVPGTGGTMCVDWCYGPGGYILNSTGGLLGPDYHLHNLALSPVIDVSSLGTAGYQLDYDVYSHNFLQPDDPGIFRIWGIRSTVSENPEDIEQAPWEDLGYLYYGLGYSRQNMNVSSLVEMGAQHVQVSLGVYEIGWVWGWFGDNGTPAPYYDNVRLSAYEVYGPGISTHKELLAQDGFPASGQLDLENPASNSVRFDMATATEVSGQYLTDAGDSIIAVVVPLREDAVLFGLPLLNYRLKANPAFDPYRASGLPTLGAVEGMLVYNEDGVLIPDRFSFDLPDTGFLYPGDVLHYYISGTDDLLGDVQTSTMPSDTTGFSKMDSPLAYDPLFTVRALPSVEEDGDSLVQSASVLFWNDAGNEGRYEWYSALLNNDLVIGENCDEYYTSAPFSGVGNGLGQRATPDQLANYSIILYTSGANIDNIMTEADAWLFTQWLQFEDKHLFATGDNLMSQLSTTSDVTQELLAVFFGVEVASYNIRPMINLQSAPVVKAEDGNPVFGLGQSWLANGGCPHVNSFDAVMPINGALRLAAFTNPSGNPDYEYSAATLNQNLGTVVSLPFAFEYVWNDHDGQGNSFNMSDRSYLLRKVLDLFGYELPYVIADTPEMVTLQTMNHPNPFNPSTTIQFILPREGHLSIKVFDVRGNLVKILLDEQHEAGAGQVVWSGTNDQGGEVSSGVYFYEVRTGGEVRVQKMALVK
jgi:hypothetical protein